MISKPLAQFYFALPFSAFITWAVQSNYVDPAQTSLLAQCYTANNLLALAVFTFLYALRKKHVEKLGFLFLAGSALRFLVFFLFFYPVFKTDGQLTRIEFALFFVPYAVSTAMETVFLIRVLNRE
ncbi:MAG: hypothetical protein RL754_743 [Bacteroidota bacterium]|jgi:Ca2+/Na+ antiporter